MKLWNACFYFRNIVSSQFRFQSLYESVFSETPSLCVCFLYKSFNSKLLNPKHLSTIWMSNQSLKEGYVAILTSSQQGLLCGTFFCFSNLAIYLLTFIVEINPLLKVHVQNCNVHSQRIQAILAEMLQKNCCDSIETTKFIFFQFKESMDKFSLY